MMARFLRWTLITVAALLLVIQVIPYGRTHANPPVRTEPAWNSSQTRMLAVRACFDCHSNETMWPWYSNMAPVSWLVQHDVEEGRETLNFSEWDRSQEGEDAAEAVHEGSMPPQSYVVLHAGARLSRTELDALISGLAATFGGSEGSAEQDAGTQDEGSEGGEEEER